MKFDILDMGISFVLVNCDMGSEIQTIEKLKELCDEVQGTYGIFDFICKLRYDDMESFEQTLLKIRKIEKITHTNTIHTIPEQS
ncbi:MAG: Lrp/AsnC ligand binding domain-containing protein [Nitrosopumilus sp.]|nr:Lrp/AsnC ligand binding domain-containing protein [Nitrososphaerota archaeon]